MYVQPVCVCERGFHISVPGSSCSSEGLLCSRCCVFFTCVYWPLLCYQNNDMSNEHLTYHGKFQITAIHLQFYVALPWWGNISCMTRQLLLTVYEALSIYVIVGSSRWTAWLTAWLTSYGRLLRYCFGYNSLPLNQLQTHTVTIHPGRSSVCFICCSLWLRQLRSGQVVSQAAEAVNHIGNHNTACK